MKDRSIHYSFADSARFNKTFESLRAFYEFMISERDYWKSQEERINSSSSEGHPAISIHGAFDGAIQTIDGWGEQVDTWNDNALNQNINSLQNSHFSNLQHQWLWSGHAFIEPFLQCLIARGRRSADAFVDYVVNGNVGNISQAHIFNGVMFGYEFVNQDSDITKRRNGEKVSLGHLRTQFSDSKDKLFSEVDEIKQDFLEWDEDARDESERLYKINKYLGERRGKRQEREFDTKLRGWGTSIAELEKTYEDLLRLKKPAEYWNKAAKRFRIQGRIFVLILLLVVVGGFIGFGTFFLAWLEGEHLPISLITLQGIVLFGSLAALYAFILRVFSRLAFSTFHLMRDAEEREQLTYLYLSLSKEAEVDKESRAIVLQALFSRTETGLLSQEHGPTMPGIGDALKIFGKSGS